MRECLQFIYFRMRRVITGFAARMARRRRIVMTGDVIHNGTAFVVPAGYTLEVHGNVIGGKPGCCVALGDNTGSCSS